MFFTHLPFLKVWDNYNRVDEDEDGWNDPERGQAVWGAYIESIMGFPYQDPHQGHTSHDKDDGTDLVFNISYAWYLENDWISALTCSDEATALDLVAN